MKLRILIIDDDPSVRDILKTALESKGHEVKALASPSEFPFLNRETCPCSLDSPCADVLITDNVMPDIEGIDLLKKLKEAGCIPIINGNVAIISGYLTIHYMNELNRLNINYFRKPFELKEIYDWIEQCQARIEQAGHSSETV